MAGIRIYYNIFDVRFLMYKRTKCSDKLDDSYHNNSRAGTTVMDVLVIQ